MTRTPTEVAQWIVGKTVDEIVVELKAWRADIERAAHREAYNDGYDDGVRQYD